MSDTKWMLYGNCHLQPTKWWFPKRGDKADDVFNFKVAKRLCNTCSVKKQCLEYGIKTNSYGMWGGVVLQGRFDRNETDTKLDLQNL
jgi:hypothetical protein